MLEILARVKDLGPISAERIQLVTLSDVAVMRGDYCDGEFRHIVFLSPEESQRFKERFPESIIERGES